MAGAHRLGEPVGGVHEVRALLLPAAALALAVAVVLVGGHMVDRSVDGQLDVGDVMLEQSDPEDLAVMDDSVVSAAVEHAAPADEPGQIVAASPPSAPAAVQPPAAAVPSISLGPETSAASRLVAPAIVAPPDLSPENLEREAPRQPLSKLSLALPPEPEIKNEWAGTPFFRPLAVESAVFQSMGRTIAIAGVKSVPVDERCEHDGVAWPCGMRARTAFRLWLRGRALVCRLPDEEREVTPARCRLAKQDAGAWLVSNGWALAAPDGPYVQAEEKARTAKMGMFGAPPEAPAIADVPDAPVLSDIPGQPVMTEDGLDPDPPADPRLAFPPAPASP
jgi:endonuclease YncB( thermonuclease family)